MPVSSLPVGRYLILICIAGVCVGSFAGITESTHAASDPIVTPQPTTPPVSEHIRPTSARSTTNRTDRTTSHLSRRSKPTIFRVAFNGPDTVGATHPTRYDIRLTAFKSVANVTAHIEPPLGGTATPQSFHLGKVDANETRTLSTNVTFNRGGTGHLTVRVTADTASGLVTRQFMQRISDTTGVATAPGGPSDTIVEPIRSNSAVPVVSSNGQSLARGQQCSGARIQGQGEYIANGATHPARSASVTLHDAHAEQPTAIASTRADQNGRFSFCRNRTVKSNSEGLYVLISAANPAAKTTKPDTDAVYQVRSTTVSNLSAGTTIVLGSNVDDDGEREIVPSTRNPAWQAVDWALDERRYIQNRTPSGWSRDSIRFKYPAGRFAVYRFRFRTATGAVTDEWIELADKETFAWNRKTILHEYAHAVMMAAYRYNADAYPTGKRYNAPHCPHSETDPEFAMAEGWAEFMEGAVDSDPTALSHLGGTIETNQWYNEDQQTQCIDGDKGDTDGASVEGSVASVLFDVIDKGNAEDESLTYGFDTVFSPIREHRPSNITAFATYWEGNRQLLSDTYARYGVEMLPDRNPDSPATITDTNITPGTVTHNKTVRQQLRFTVTNASSDASADNYTVVFPSETTRLSNPSITVTNTTGAVIELSNGPTIRNTTEQTATPELSFGVQPTASNWTQRLTATIAVNLKYAVPAPPTNTTILLRTMDRPRGDVEPITLGTVRITPRSDPATFSVTRLRPASEPIQQGAPVSVAATLANTGDTEGTQTVTLRIDRNDDAVLGHDEVLAKQRVSLAPNATDTVRFDNISTDGLASGVYTYGVRSANDTASAQLTVRNVSALVVGEDTPAASLPVKANGDGNEATLDDVDGDGDLDIGDVILLLEALESELIQSNRGAFDFTRNGGVDVLDVIHLLERV